MLSLPLVTSHSQAIKVTYLHLPSQSDGHTVESNSDTNCSSVSDRMAGSIFTTLIMVVTTCYCQQGNYQYTVSIRHIVYNIKNNYHDYPLNIFRNDVLNILKLL